MTATSDQLVSIIIPVYRVEPYLDGCVGSVLAQTHANIEVILVDDGSPDRCGEMCDAWAARDARVRVIHQPNGGLSVARNTGIDAARGQWLMFVDSDDHVLPTFCERPLSLAVEHDADIVVFDCDEVDDTGAPRAEQRYHMRARGLLTREEALCALARCDMYEFAWSKLYRREVFDSVRFVPGIILEDQITAYECAYAANRVFACGDRLYRYLQRNDSLSHSGPAEVFAQEVENRTWACEYLTSRCPEAAECMQTLAAQKELRLIRLQYRHLLGDRRLREIRSILVSRPVDASRLTKGERRDLALVKAAPMLFFVEQEARMLASRLLRALRKGKWATWLKRPQR